MAHGLSGTAGKVVWTVNAINTIEEIAEWSLNVSHTPVDVTTFGDAWEHSVPSMRSATGSFSGNHMNGVGNADMQNNVRNSMLGGLAFSLRLYVDTNFYYNIETAYFTGQTDSSSSTGKADASWDFQVSGEVTYVDGTPV